MRDIREVKVLLVMAIVILGLVSISPFITDVSTGVNETAEIVVGNLTGIATSDEFGICFSGQSCLYGVDVSGSVDDVTWLGSIPAYYSESHAINKGDTLTGYVALHLDEGYIDGGSNDYWINKKKWFVCRVVIPFPGCNNPPTDPDNDGLYEDINGYGRKDFDDVVCFFENLEWVEKNQPRCECFDFNENGRIDFDDVVKLV